MLAVRNQRFNFGPPTYVVATLVGLLNAYLFLGLMIALAALYLLPTPELRVEAAAGDD
jgi:hypothetical protein